MNTTHYRDPCDTHVDKKNTSMTPFLNNDQAGAAFVIPALEVEQRFHTERDYETFTDEPMAIPMALNYLFSFSVTIIHALFCVDSEPALRHLDMKVRGELIGEISHIIHFLFFFRGSTADFCWVPSHSGNLDI